MRFLEWLTFQGGYSTLSGCFFLQEGILSLTVHVRAYTDRSRFTTRESRDLILMADAACV